jgi:hypothetical protein
VDKALAILTLTTNVSLTLGHFLLQSTSLLIAKTPCMIHQSKDLAPFTCNLKNQQKCAADLICLFTDASVAPQETIRTHQPQDVQQDVLCSVTLTGKNSESETS